MDASQHLDSELLLSVPEVILEESVVESEIMRSIYLEGENTTSDPSSNLKQEVAKLQMTRQDLNTVEKYDEGSGPAKNIVENSITSGDSNKNIEKKNKPKARRKPKVRSSPLKILPRPNASNAFGFTDEHNALQMKEKLGEVSPQKILMQVEGGSKLSGSPVTPTSPFKRGALSLQEKLSMIKELENGKKQKDICRKTRLHKSTIQSIWKNRDKIRGALSQIGEKRKRHRRAHHEDIEEKLLEWVALLKSQNIPVTGPQLRAKALVYAKCLGISEFRCSAGWLDKFKKRHNIALRKTLKSPKDGAAGDMKVALDWVTKIWPSFCEGYSSKDIFNAKESALFYKALPDELTLLKNEACHEGSMAKDRLTILLCTNSVGTEKLKPVVIGCQRNPKSFIWVPSLDNLPVEYIYDCKSWMTQDIFTYWLTVWDKKLQEAGRNILLILDNSPAHVVNVPITNIKLVCLPPIVASLLQPLEHGVSKVFKARYRHLLLDRLVRKTEDMDSSSKASISLLEAISMVHAAWTEVSPQVITDCFKNTNLQSLSVSINVPVFSPSINSEQDFKIDSALLEQAGHLGIRIPLNFSLHTYILIDSKLHVTDYGIIENSAPANNILKIEKPEDNDSGGDTLENVIIPSRRDVQMFLDAIRNWAMISNEHCDYSVHTALGILENFAVQQSIANPPVPNVHSTNTHNGASHNGSDPGLNLDILATVPITIPMNTNTSANSASDTLKNNFDSPPPDLYTPNLETSHIIQCQNESVDELVLPIEAPTQNNVTHVLEGENSVTETIQGQAENGILNPASLSLTANQQHFLSLFSANLAS